MKKYIIFLAIFTLASYLAVAQVKPIKRPQSNNPKTEQMTKQNKIKSSKNNKSKNQNTLQEQGKSRQQSSSPSREIADNTAKEKAAKGAQKAADILKNETIVVNGISIDMVYVSNGSFTMGKFTESSDEMYSHTVTLSSYYIGKYEVTQSLWTAVMGGYQNASTKDMPVDKISWYECQEFITKLNRLTGKKFRMPTEAEWEFAAIGGNYSKGFKYSGSNSIDDVAWYNGNSLSSIHVVGTKTPNELEIYDMSGNVWEWCQDWYDVYKKRDTQYNPTGPAFGSDHVVRGGCYYNYASFCCVSRRSSFSPSYSMGSIGLRLAASSL